MHGEPAMGALDAWCGPCAACGRTVRVVAVLYTADARPLCPLCFTKADVVAARRRAGFDRSGAALLGATAAAMPFAATAALRGGGAMHGWLALAGGAVAVVCGAATLHAARARASARWFGLGLLILALGAYHLAWSAGWAS